MDTKVTKENLQEFATKMHAKNKSMFALKSQMGTPPVVTTAASMTDQTKIYVYMGTETGYIKGGWYYYSGSAWTFGGMYNSGDWIGSDLKQALLQLASKVAYIDDDGQDYYDALESALYHDATLVSISAVYTQSGTVYDTDSLDDLKSDLVVTALYSDASTATITAYTLSGTLTAGTSTITVTYMGKTTTFGVTVTAYYQTLTYIEADGNSYIDTDFVPDQNTKIVLDYMSLKASGVAFQCPIGATQNVSDASGKSFFFYIGSANGVTASVSQTGSTLPVSGLTVNNGDRKVYELSLSDFSVSGVSYGTPRQDKPLTESVGYPLTLFSRNHANTNFNAKCTGRAYELSIYSSGTLVKHFVPVKRSTDNAYGMLETESNTFYGNDGSGTLTGA